MSFFLVRRMARAGGGVMTVLFLFRQMNELCACVCVYQQVVLGSFQTLSVAFLIFIFILVRVQVGWRAGWRAGSELCLSLFPGLPG